MTLQKFDELFSPLRQSYTDLLQEVESEKAKVEEQKKKLASKAKVLDERESSLVERESELAKKEVEVEAKFSKIRTDETVRQEMINIETTRENYLKDIKKNEEVLGLTKLTLEEISKRELALSEKEKNYKERIELEFAKNFLKSK